MKYLNDAYAPAEIAQRVLNVGVSKARMGVFDALALAFLAGAFIGLGAAFATLVTTDTGLGFGPTRFLGGIAFSLGLILVVVAGAELFTGNNLVAMAWASKKISTRQMARNWFLVYIGNLAGALGTVALVYWAGTWSLAGDQVGLNAIKIAAAKCDIGFFEAMVRGILCNFMVCLAVWLCQSGRSTTDKILAIVWPISGFVALGFEHSVANMYFIPLGLLLKLEPELVATANTASISLDGLTFNAFLGNLIPVTIGNILGGTLLVAGVYWLIYLRNASEGDSV